MRRIQTAGASYGRTACTNVGRFSRSWGVRFDQRGTGRQDFGVFLAMNGSRRM